MKGETKHQFNTGDICHSPYLADSQHYFAKADLNFFYIFIVVTMMQKVPYL